MTDLVTFGETMVSMTPTELGALRYVGGFRAKIAGAESNVAIGAARLGLRAKFVTALGDDSLGRLVYGELLREGVDCADVRWDAAHRTGVMFKERLAPRETNVWYYRENSAASHMTPDILPDGLLRGTRILHLTGVTMALGWSCREAVFDAAQRARAAGVTVVFDPNIRLRLWSAEAARESILALLPDVDVLLPGVDECALLFGEDTLEGYAARIRSYGVRCGAIKLGRHGCAVFGENGLETLPPYPFDDVVETVGAGDAFAAGFIAGLAEGRTLAECGAMANCMGAMATKSADDYQSLPTRRELDVLLRKAPKPIER